VLLSDIAAHVKAGGNLDSVLLSLRRALEADRFGFVAHTLAVRDGCSNARCATLALLRDPEQVRANLSAQTFDHYIDHYSAMWGQGAESPIAEAAPPSTGTVAATQPPAVPPKKVILDADFPSAASIPAVSIMNPEPRAGSANVAGEAHAGSGRRSSRKAASSPPVAPPPPSAATLVLPVDPVWGPGTAPVQALQPSAPAPSAPQANAGQAPAAQ